MSESSPNELSSESRANEEQELLKDPKSRQSLETSASVEASSSRAAPQSADKTFKECGKDLPGTALFSFHVFRSMSGVCRSKHFC